MPRSTKSSLWPDWIRHLCPFAERATFRALTCLLLAGILWLLAVPRAAIAGDFTINWGTSPYTWTSGTLGPQTYVLTDQYGFQVNARFRFTQTGGTASGGTPNDLTGYGLNPSLQLQWNASSGSSGIGESTNTATLELLNGTTAYPVGNLTFQISDIDAADGNNGIANYWLR